MRYQMFTLLFCTHPFPLLSKILHLSRTCEIVEIKTVKTSIQNGPGLVGTNKMSPESWDQ